MNANENIPVLDITNGVDPSNSQWRTKKEFFKNVTTRHTEMTEFMKTLGIKRLSTHLTYGGNEYRVLIDNNSKS